MAQLLGEQLVSPVLWEQAMREMLRRGVNELYEVGPGELLRKMMERIDVEASAGMRCVSAVAGDADEQD